MRYLVLITVLPFFILNTIQAQNFELPKVNFQRDNKATELQVTSVTASLGWTGFIESLPLINRLETVETPTNTKYVVFFSFSDSSKFDSTTLKYQDIDSTFQDGWKIDYPMSIVKPLWTIASACYDANWKLIQNTVVYKTFEVIQKPKWFDIGKVTVESTTNRRLNLKASLPISTIIKNGIPNNVSSLSNRPYDLADVKIAFDIQFDMDNRQSIIQNRKLIFNLNILNQNIDTWSGDLSKVANKILLDKNFDLFIEFDWYGSSNTFSMNTPSVSFPLVPPFTVKVDAGLKLQLDVKAKVLFGFSNGQCGFISVNDTTSSFIASVSGTGYIRGTLDILGGLVGSATGTLIVDSKIGGGINFRTVPTNVIEPLFGGDLNIRGRITLKGLFGLIKIGEWEKEFYDKTWGNLPIGKIKTDKFGNVFQSNKSKVDLAYIPPSYMSQPFFNNHNGNMGIVWLEMNSNIGNLFYSRYNKISKSFEPLIKVVSNSNGINSPKLSFLKDGSTIIVWIQNKQSIDNVINPDDIDSYLNNQEAHYAILDNTSSEIKYTGAFSKGKNAMGEGEVEVNVNNNDEAVCVWTYRLPSLQITALSTTIYKVGNQFYATEIIQIENLPNNVRNIHLANYGQTSIASWIGDNTNDNIRDNIMSYAVNENNKWITGDTLINVNPNFRRMQQSLALHSNGGGIAWSATEYKENGTFTNEINARTWKNGKWNNYNSILHAYDSLYIREPRIAYTTNSLMVVAYQSEPRYSDLAPPSTHNIIVRDDNNNLERSYVYKPSESVFVWDYQITVVGDTLYLITQEKDTILGDNYIPQTGVRFGSLSAGLVLRTFKINSDLSISKIKEPDVPTGIIDDVNNKSDITLNNYPNPFSQSTVFEITVNSPTLARLQLYDYLGNEVLTLLNEHIDSGMYEVSYSSNDLPSGLYIAKLTAGKSIIYHKVVKK
ncbi:MAG: T9SS type A sorting domain-containing protein [Candidatus Kapabacteria bacterium]|nr:T9SS type A sorting domain-containing protein [Candidatus Kapabacteria bacterium]